MRLLSFSIVVVASLGALRLANAEDTTQKPAPPKYVDSDRVRGLFLRDKGKCQELCKRAYRPGYELSNDICIATCTDYP
jgi:hypothetical protein